MRTTSTATSSIRLFGATRPHRLGRPSRLPSIVPTRSSYLQRLLWIFGVGR